MTQTAICPMPIAAPVSIRSLEDVVKDIRAEIKANPRSVDRTTFLLYAFLRGMPHEMMERRVSEHNLNMGHATKRCPDISWDLMSRLHGRGWSSNRVLHAEREARKVEIDAWGTIPEDRIKRFGPRTPKLRPSNRKAES